MDSRKADPLLGEAVEISTPDWFTVKIYVSRMML